MTKKMRMNSIDHLVRLMTIVGIVIMATCTQATPPNTTQTEAPQATSSAATSKASATLPNASATPPSATPEIKANNVTITYGAYLQPDQMAILQPLVDEFNRENPTIKVVLISLYDAQIHQPGDIAKQADVITMEANLAYTPSFINMQPLVDASVDFNLHDFWPGISSACSDQDGNLYGVPLTYSPIGIYHDPKIFDQNHVPNPQPGWTWAQFQQTIAQVSGTTAAGKPIYGFVDGFGASVLDPILDKQLLASGGKVDPQALAASMDWYMQMVKAQKLWSVQFSNMVPIPGKTDQWATKWNPLVDDGQAAMWVSSPAVPTVTSYPGLPGSENKVGVFVPYPLDQPDDHTSPAIVTCAAINASSRNSQAAWAWFDYLSQHDLIGSAASGQLPARQSLTRTSSYWTSLSEQDRASIQSALEHAWYPSDLESIRSNVLNTVSSTIESGKDLVTALQGIAETTASVQPQPTLEPFVVNTPPGTQSAEVQSIAFNSGFWVGAAKGGLDGLIVDFEKLHPDISVKIVDNNPSTDDPTNPDYGHDLRNLARNYDCFEYLRPDLDPLSSNDLLDLTPWMVASPELKGDFYPAFLAPFEKDGKLYALPTGTTIQYIAYNADLLTRLGLPFPTSGWTFDNLLSLTAQAANPTASKPVYGLAADPGSLLAASGVHWYNSTVQPPKALFNTDGVAKGLTWLDQLYQKGTLFTPGNNQDYWQKIASGQVALWTLMASKPTIKTASSTTRACLSKWAMRRCLPTRLEECLVTRRPRWGITYRAKRPMLKPVGPGFNTYRNNPAFSGGTLHARRFWKKSLWG